MLGARELAAPDSEAVDQASRQGFEAARFPCRVSRRQIERRLAVELIEVRADDRGFFEAGTVVTPELLREQGLVRANGRIKVLARGDISKALTVRAHKFSGKAAEKIAAAGGSRCGCGEVASTGEICPVAEHAQG